MRGGNLRKTGGQIALKSGTCRAWPTEKKPHKFIKKDPKRRLDGQHIKH